MPARSLGAEPQRLVEFCRACAIAAHVRGSHLGIGPPARSTHQRTRSSSSAASWIRPRSMCASIAQKRPHISTSGLWSVCPVAIITVASLARSSTWSGPPGKLAGSQGGHQGVGIIGVVSRAPRCLSRWRRPIRRSRPSPREAGQQLCRRPGVARQVNASRHHRGCRDPWHDRRRARG